MLWPCSDMKVPCLVPNMMTSMDDDENYKDTKGEWQEKFADWLTKISSKVAYQPTDCVALRFFKGSMSPMKKDKSDMEVNIVLCPYKVKETAALQKAIWSAFERSM